VEVIWHHDEIMEKVFAFVAVVIRTSMNNLDER
jgi:hypothetical protein